MFNTIILVIVAIITGIYAFCFLDIVNEGEFRISHLLVVILGLAILIQAKSYSNPNSQTYAEAYANGFDAAIESAELVEVNDDSYSIKYGTLGTNIHKYTFED